MRFIANYLRLLLRNILGINKKCYIAKNGNFIEYNLYKNYWMKNYAGWHLITVVFNGLFLKTYINGLDSKENKKL